jgi:hypothetical protein
VPVVSSDEPVDRIAAEIPLPRRLFVPRLTRVCETMHEALVKRVRDAHARSIAAG